MTIVTNPTKTSNAAIDAATPRTADSQPGGSAAAFDVSPTTGRDIAWHVLSDALRADGGNALNIQGQEQESGTPDIAGTENSLSLSTRIANAVERLDEAWGWEQEAAFAYRQTRAGSHERWEAARELSGAALDVATASAEYRRLWDERGEDSWYRLHEFRSEWELRRREPVKPVANVDVGF